MNSRFNGFQEKRMKIFGEIVKRYWKDNLKSVEDLNVLTQDIKEKFDFKDEDNLFIKEHIRMAMGLHPTGKAEFENELAMIKNSKEIAEPIVAKIPGACENCTNENCKEMCKYEAHVYTRNEGPVIVNNKCLTCGQCVSSCDFGALADKIEFIPVIDLLKEEKVPVYAVVAPAIVGQFGDDVSMGQVRTALKLLGFQDMIEAALFADILTIKEAVEFNHLVKNKEDVFLTSCCCPVWFNLIKKNYPDIFSRMSPAVSPMIASGRFLKKLYPEAKVVFIAPCVAKKAEIAEPELKGAIDYVLNFRELSEIFTVLDMNLKELASDEKDQASMGGRLYGRTGGVSFSVKTIVNRLEPTRVIKLNSRKADGVKNCRQVLDDLSNGKDINANFIEGMACNGGCVGGPRTNIDVDKATKMLNNYGEDSLIMTPFDNLNVMKILNQSGLNSIEDITKNEEIIKIITRN